MPAYAFIISPLRKSPIRETIHEREYDEVLQPAQRARSIVRAGYYTTRARPNPTNSVGFCFILGGAALRSRRAPQRRPFAQPLGLPAGQAEKCVRGSAIGQLEPAPLHRPGALSLDDSTSQCAGDLGSFREAAFLTFGEGERHVYAAAHEVQPAQLAVSDRIFPGPLPRRPHETDLLRYSLDVHQSLAQRAKPCRSCGGQVLQRRGGHRLHGGIGIEIGSPVGVRPSHQDSPRGLRSRYRTTSMPMARRSDASRPSRPARKTISRKERMTLSVRRVLKKSTAQSAPVQSVNNCSSCPDVAGSARLRGGFIGTFSPPRAFQLSYAMMATAWARLSERCPGSVAMVTSALQRSSSAFVRPLSSRPATIATGPSDARRARASAASRGRSTCRFAARSRPVRTAVKTQSAIAASSESRISMLATKPAVLCAMPSMR